MKGLNELNKSALSVDPGGWDQQLAEVQTRIDRLSERVSTEGAAGHQAKAVAFFQQTLALHDLQTLAIDLAVPGSPEAQDRDLLPAPLYCQYVISTLFFGDCYAYLMQGAAEWLVAVTGIRLGGTIYTLDRMVTTDLEVQSAARATADSDSVFRALLGLAENGHVLHAVFHSHRSRGIPCPSSIDRDLQQRLERGGYPAIQAIFSDDGFVRFFGGQKPFEIKVYGTGAEKINERVYKLPERC